MILDVDGANTMKRSELKKYCDNDRDCKRLADDCNDGVCDGGECKIKPNIFSGGSRKYCRSTNKCAFESRCYLHGSKGVCEDELLRDCSCHDDIDKCEEGTFFFLDPLAHSADRFPRLL